MNMKMETGWAYSQKSRQVRKKVTKEKVGREVE